MAQVQELIGESSKDLNSDIYTYVPMVSPEESK